MRFDDLEVVDLNETEDTIEFQENKKEQDSNDPKKIRKEILNYVITLAITMLIVLVLKNYVLINANVPTGSMENTIMAGDNLFGNRLAYVDDTPERGDIIFFYYPDDESQKFIKRVIGLPGETVRIEDGKVYIDDSTEPLDEPYLKEEWINGTGPYVFEVPEGCYFVMGDNRNSSRDSRFWNNTYVAEEKIIGEAILIYYPFEDFGFVE